jgi:DNA primase
MDAIQAHQAGFHNVVAQMGTAMTEAQLKQLAPRYAKRIVMALDADAAGQNATLRGLDVARETLQADYTGKLSVDIRILAIPDAKDPDDLIRETPERWQSLVDNATPVADYVIAVETAQLPSGASLQEREAAARRVLPILAASENDLYKKDNLQKLAVKLHIQERDLLAWADEQQKIANARAPRTGERRSKRGESQEIPPPGDPTVEQGGDAAYNGAAASKPLAPMLANEAALEGHCLRLLLLRPELFYHVNRKFRELAGEDTTLSQGPLRDLTADDFSRSEYRVLMEVFKAALEQDDMEPLDFVRAQLDPGLRDTMEAILISDEDGLRDRLRHRLLADLAASLKQSGRLTPPVDISVELMEKALKLRVQRLQREREELAFLLMDPQADDDPAAELAYQNQIRLSILAKRLIEAELQRQASLMKQF